LLSFRHRPPPPRSPLFPYTTLFRSARLVAAENAAERDRAVERLLDFYLHSAAAASTSIEIDNVRFDYGLGAAPPLAVRPSGVARSEEHTSELQSRFDLVCRLLLEKK